MNSEKKIKRIITHDTKYQMNPSGVNERVKDMTESHNEAKRADQIYYKPQRRALSAISQGLNIIKIASLYSMKEGLTIEDLEFHLPTITDKNTILQEITPLLDLGILAEIDPSKNIYRITNLGLDILHFIKMIFMCIDNDTSYRSVK